MIMVIIIIIIPSEEEERETKGHGKDKKQYRVVERFVFIFFYLQFLQFFVRRYVVLFRPIRTTPEINNIIQIYTCEPYCIVLLLQFSSRCRYFITPGHRVAIYYRRNGCLVPAGINLFSPVIIAFVRVFSTTLSTLPRVL